MISTARMITLVAFLAIAAVALFADVDRRRAGQPSATLAPDGPTTNTRYVVTAAPPTSPLRRGDRVEIDDPRESAAFAFHSLAVGSTLKVRRIAPLPQALLADPIVPARVTSLRFAFVLLELLFIGIAALIAARGRSSGSFSLAWLFELIVVLFNPTTPAWPPWLILTFALFSGMLSNVGFLCATDFATRFAGDPQAQWARRFRRVSGCLGLAAIALSLSTSFISFLTPTTPVALQNTAIGALLFQALGFLAALGTAYARAPAADRQRVLWVALSLAIGVVGFVLTVAAGNAGIPEPARDVPLLLLIAMPLGCAYAILRYRLLDIAFVVNRATVFGITSLLVLAALALVDFGLQTLLGSWLLRTGLYVQLGLALAIGIATRPLHERVDRFVDDLFFRGRHEAERKLRQFAREVAYIDDTAIVLARTVETVAHAAHLDCALLLMTNDGLVEAATSENANLIERVDRNDGAVVRLLANRETVDLHDVETAIPGDFAFPMFARNRLVGMLICGSKADGVNAYAPDELDAISAVAHATGLALDLLRIETLERELDRLRSSPLRSRSLRRVSKAQESA